MSQRPLQLAVSSGAASVLLLIVGNEISKEVGGSPGLHDPAARYLEGMIGADQTPVLQGHSLIVLGYLLLLPFVLGLRRLLDADGNELLPSLLTGAGTLTVAVGLIGAIPAAPLSVLAADGELSAETAKALVTMNAAAWVLTWATTSVWVAAAAALILRTSVLPRPFGWIGAALAPALLAAATLVWVVEAFTLAWLVTILWTLTVSVVAAVRAGRPHRRGIGAGPAPVLVDPNGHPGSRSVRP